MDGHYKRLATLCDEIFSCFLQPDYPDNLYLYERRLHIAKIKCLRTLTPNLYSLYELLLDCAQLRSRVGDHSTFGTCAQELRDIATNLRTALINQQIDELPLSTSIQRLEDSYHNVLQIAARDPVVFLLFINSLKNLCTELKKAKKLKSMRPKAHLQHASRRASLSLTNNFLYALVTVIVASLLNCYITFSYEFWLPLTAFLICYLSRGAPLRFAMVIFSSMMLTAIAFRPFSTILVTGDRLIDIGLGTIIGIIFSKLIFPVNLQKQFCTGLIPLLQALIYSANNLTAIQIPILIQAQQVCYPEWVYSPGFNRGLRASWRFFLINLERITELFFSTHYWAAFPVDPILFQDLNGRFTASMQKNQELLEILLTYLEKSELRSTDSNYTDDIKELEQSLHRLLPPNLELLDISPDYVTLVTLTRNLKDLRTLLLQLVKALE